MTVGYFVELILPYDPTELAGKVAKRRARFIGRLISLAISIAISVGIYVWQREALGGSGYFVITGVFTGILVLWAVVHLLGFLQARRELRDARQGVAVRMGPPGVQVADLAVVWSYVQSLDTVRGGPGRSPRLRLRTTDGRSSLVPFDQIQTFPATLDSSARAFSAGRHGVDLSALED